MKNLFAERLTQLLKENNLSKRQLALLIGVSAQSISDWSTGKIQPIAENIYLVAEYFETSADFLLGLEDESGRRVNKNIVNNNFSHNHGTITQTINNGNKKK